MSRERRVTATAVEFSPATHCNLRCAGCSHSSPYAPPRFIAVESFVRNLSVLSRYMLCRQFRIIGGEPLLHPDVLEIARAARRSGLARHIQLVTNGLLLARQPGELWDELDSVKVTAYPATAGRLDLAHFRRMAAEHSTTLMVAERPTFRVPVADLPIGEERLVHRIFPCCGMARACHTIAEGRLYRCSIAPFMDSYVRRLGYETDFAHTEGVAIEDRDDMAERVRRYLSSDVPLAACRFCLGSVGRNVPHRQLSADEVAHPERTGRARDLLSPTMLRAELRRARYGTLVHYLPRPLRRAVHRLLGSEWSDANADVFRPSHG